MLDLVVIGYPKTIPLLRLMHSSFLRHYRGTGKLYIFIEDRSFGFVKNMAGRQCEIIKKEDILPNHFEYNGYLTQQFFKLTAGQVVNHQHYLVVDDDYLFINRTDETDFFWNGKPFWFFQDWQRAGGASRWRDSTEKYLGIAAPYCFITTPAFVLSRQVLEAMNETFNHKEILNQESFAEFQAYGTYAFERFHEFYHWVNGFWGDEVFGCRVNQPPPNYLTLDPTIQRSSFQAFKYLQFWSHWGKVEEKMKEFALESEK